MSAAQPEQLVSVPAGSVVLEGALALPPRPRGVVVFSHGSGSGRFSPRNRFVAAELHKLAVGTLLLDLLTEAEERDYERRFDIDLLTPRLGHHCDRELRIVPGATHLFEEPGTLEEVARLAGLWFTRHLGPNEPSSTR